MIDFTSLIEQNLKGESRNTGMLHCSSHLTAPLRHTQLYMTGLFERDFDFMGVVRMMTGTLWHEKLEDWMRRSGKPFMSEIDLTGWLPDGWTGRCDYLVWDEYSGKFQVLDIKTIKGEGVKWLNGKPKDDHVWQVSAYVHGAVCAGLPVDTERAYVYYLPMNDADGAEPVLTNFIPLGVGEVAARMHEVKYSVDEFISKCADKAMELDVIFLKGDEMQEFLAPIMEPEQRLYKDSKTGNYDVKMVPHWTSKFCPYPEVCGCSEQSTYKVGHFARDPEGDWVYVPRKGYEDVPLVVTMEGK